MSGLRRKHLRRTRKPLVGRYYQLLSVHAAIGTYLMIRKTNTSEYWWCDSGEQQSRHPLSTRYRAWTTQLTRLLKGVGKALGLDKSQKKCCTSHRYKPIQGVLNNISKIDHRLVPFLTIRPYEMWHGKPPNLSNIRVFGCIAYNVPKQKRRQKIDSESCRCIFLGIQESTQSVPPL